MDFTEIYRQSSSLVAFSPGAHFIMTAVQDRIIVRRTDTFQITRTWLVDSTPNPTQALFKAATTSKSTKPPISTSPEVSTITHLGWSCDSEYILAACAKKGVVHLLKLRDEEWNGRIDAGAEGLLSAEWAPDGRTVVCFSEWGLRVSLWSLTNGTPSYIQFPIHPDKGYAFRSDGRYFLLGERHKSKDTLGVYDSSEAYRLVRHFPLPTSTFAGLALSPTGNHVAVWDGPLDYKLHVVNLAGDHLTTFTPSLDPGFGIRCVAWHPNGMFLAAGGFDDKIHILDSLSWSEVVTLDLTTKLSAHVTVWREPSKWLETTEGRGFLSYDRLYGQQILSSTRADPTKPHPKSGVVQLDWNLNGSYLLVRFENVQNAVYIYDFPASRQTTTPKLRTVLLHSQPALHARWNPVRKGSLSLCCGLQSVYTWSDEWHGEGGEEEEMAECIGVPAKKFETRDLRWAPDGKGFILLGRDQFCCAFEVSEEAEEIQN
ncbi:WD repeat-containing protein 8 [Crepidotus variabilis]|uniref:WD repeat-containing protein 8 n=1 Tax=Crepidotus variabilis TaxID=179855 RepID=A0A9P6E7T3_9AGAR|nr:WD repeat-containing protein 8 [Crepidotus variabilis]